MKTAACIELRLYQITSTTLCRVCWPTRVPPATVVGSGTSWCIRRERGRLFFYPPLAICMCLRGVSVCTPKLKGEAASPGRTGENLLLPPPPPPKYWLLRPDSTFRRTGRKRDKTSQREQKEDDDKEEVTLFFFFFFFFVLWVRWVFISDGANKEECKELRCCHCTVTTCCKGVQGSAETQETRFQMSDRWAPGHTRPATRLLLLPCPHSGNERRRARQSLRPKEILRVLMVSPTRSATRRKHEGRKERVPPHVSVVHSLGYSSTRTPRAHTRTPKAPRLLDAPAALWSISYDQYGTSSSSSSAV